MPNISTFVRLAVVAVAMSFTLTSCFDHDKKCDPKPSNCPSKTKTPSGGDN